MVPLFALLLSAAQAPSAAPSPREIANRFFVAFNTHDTKAMARLYAADAVLASPDFCAPRGAADVERTYRALFTALPDLRDDVEQVIQDGEMVAVRFTARASTRHFRLPIASIMRVRNGLIVEDRSYFDTKGRRCEG
jgi:ketosteroid isomerase-like protein